MAKKEKKGAPPPQVPPPQPRPLGKIYTAAETRQQEEEIAALLPHQTQGYIARVMRERHGISPDRVKRLSDRIRERWVQEDEASGALQANRADAVRRIKRMIGVASGRKDQGGNWVEKPNHSAVARYEHILANLQGTYAPVKVDLDVRVSASVQHVIANLTADQVREHVERMRELRELAERARVLEAPALPAKSG